MAICLVMELADAPINLFVPIGLAVAVSAFTASQLSGPLANLPLPRLVHSVSVGKTKK